MLHRFLESSSFDLKLQTAELEYLFTSKAALTALAENYVWLPFETIRSEHEFEATGSRARRP
jgi:hypothetical protein